MYHEIDEGIDSTSIYGSIRRDCPTFIADETLPRERSENPIIFPQRLDLSSMQSSTPKKEKKSGRKKRISPIKATNQRELSFNYGEHRKESSYDLDSIQKQFDKIASELKERSLRKSSSSSVTSDRASSVSSTSSGLSTGQKSIFIQVSRAKQLINNKEHHHQPKKDGKQGDDVALHISDSDFHLTTDYEEEEDDETRPPSSQASLAYDASRQLEKARRAAGSSNLISHIGKQKTSSSTCAKHRNAGTMSDTMCLSDSQLYQVYEKRAAPVPKCARRHYPDPDEITLTEHSPVMDRTVVDEVFEDFSKETPILRGGNSSVGSLGTMRIERARDATAHRSASMNNIVTTGGLRKQMSSNREYFDGIAPGALRHSVSTIQVSPQKLRELHKEASNSYPAIPGLARFVIKPSTRDIFPLPLDIDAIAGKGVRRDEKSTQRIFGGKTIASQIHGDRPTPRDVTRPLKSSGAQRPTTASTAKKVVHFQPTPLNSSQNSTQISTKIPPKISNPAPKAPQRVAKPPAYCSATSSDGTAYSISTVTQQLLGTVKSLHPDWLQMIRRLLNEHDDVASGFQLMLIQEKEILEAKWLKNQNEGAMDESHSLQRITVISRVLERMEELGNAGNTSKVQQIKMIHSALLST